MLDLLTVIMAAMRLEEFISNLIKRQRTEANDAVYPFQKYLCFNHCHAEN